MSPAKKVAGSKDGSQPSSDKESDSDKQKKQAPKGRGKSMGRGRNDVLMHGQSETCSAISAAEESRPEDGTPDTDTAEDPAAGPAASTGTHLFAICASRYSEAL